MVNTFDSSHYIYDFRVILAHLLLRDNMFQLSVDKEMSFINVDRWLWALGIQNNGGHRC